jgi:hypothetical protein
VVGRIVRIVLGSVEVWKVTTVTVVGKALIGTWMLVDGRVDGWIHDVDGTGTVITGMLTVDGITVRTVVGIVEVLKVTTVTVDGKPLTGT